MIKKIEYDDRAVWFLNGVVHREDGPAIEYHNGQKEWFFNGESHREDGPAVEFADGAKEWWQNGKWHREDGPAREYDGLKQWWVNGLWIRYIKLYLARDYFNCIGQFLLKKKKKYLILCFERDNYYFYTVLWDSYASIDGKRYDCSLEELKSLL